MILQKTKICEVCGSTNSCSRYPDLTGQILCRKHKSHLRKYGEIQKASITDANNIILKKNFAVIVLLNKNGKQVGRSYIDLDDVERVSKYKWCLTSHGYAFSYKVGYLHRFIMGATDSDIKIDHRNHLPLHNRKYNLRTCTHQQNNFNKGLMVTNSSGVVGVSWNKSKSMWSAQIGVNKKTIHLGRFSDIDDAIKARRKAELIYFGEFAYNL